MYILLTRARGWWEKWNDGKFTAAFSISAMNINVRNRIIVISERKKKTITQTAVNQSIFCVDNNYFRQIGQEDFRVAWLLVVTRAFAIFLCCAELTIRYFTRVSCARYAASNALKPWIRNEKNWIAHGITIIYYVQSIFRHFHRTARVS